MWKIFKTAFKLNTRSLLKNGKLPLFKICTTCIIGGSLISYYIVKYYNCTIHEVSTETKENLIKLGRKERRFNQFASVEYDGQYYMTPQDFLVSVIGLGPRPRLKRRELTLEDIEYFKKVTPSSEKGTSRLFRDLGDNGIVSFTEYLFLLSILVKPKVGFEIAFAMFDTDGNERVDKNEFLVIETVISALRKNNRTLQQNKNDHILDVEDGLQKTRNVDTTLLIHFFGSNNNGINYKHFKKFMENIQTEVIELEFNEYSRGLTTITERDFAESLLRYTNLSQHSHDMYIQRLMERRKNKSKGITFEEYHMFCIFLNNLEDFIIALQQFSMANIPINKTEFRHAANICTDSVFSDHLIDTVFAIFDTNDDGFFSYKEFIDVTFDRKLRAIHRSRKLNRWISYKKCVWEELNALTI